MTAPWDADAPSAESPTGTIGRYRIERGLGAGGMGVVVAAYDQELDRAVAIKFLQRGETAAQERLVVEARAMARISHPNVVAVHEVIRWGDRAGIVMDLVDGPDLGRWARERPRTWRELVEVYLQATRGLAAAHRAGLVHRDFKPANALFGRDGVVRVTDFGLARTLDETEASTAGTPAFMAPEQRAGAVVDARTDQWALGFALKRALSSLERLGPPAPRWVRRALARATADAPDDRFPDLDHLCAALAPRRRRWPLVAMGATVALGLGALAATTGSRAAAPPSCADLADGELAGAWSPVRRAMLLTGFAARGPAAAATGARTAAALDANASAWRAARIEACGDDRRAAIAPALSDLRRACLERRRAELGALVEALRSPSVETVTRSHATTFLLTAPTTCLDLEELRRREPVPEDPARRPMIAAARARLDSIRAQAEVGRLRHARRELVSLIDQARREGWPPLLSEALVEAGLVAASERDFTAADRWLDEGVLVAEAAGYDLVTMRGLIALVDVRGRGLTRLDDGLALVPRAQAVLTRLGGAPEHAEALDTYRGRILLVQGKYREALEVFTAVLASRRARDPRHPAVAESEIDLGDALQKSGRPTEALPHYQAALALRRELFGRDHALVARAIYSVGNGLVELGQHEAAAATYAEALAAYETLYGPDHPILASALNNLGFAMILAGRSAQALPILERGLAIATASDHEPLNQALLEGNLGDALRRLGRLDEAAPHLVRSLDGFRAVYGPDNPQLVPALVDLAKLELDRGQAGSARDHLRDAARLATPLGSDHPLAIDVRDRLAALTSSPSARGR